jgi:hypothetical protein
VQLQNENNYRIIQLLAFMTVGYQERLEFVREQQIFFDLQAGHSQTDVSTV